MFSKLCPETGYYDRLSMILYLTAKYLQNLLKLGLTVSLHVLPFH